MRRSRIGVGVGLAYLLGLASLGCAEGASEPADGGATSDASLLDAAGVPRDIGVDLGRPDGGASPSTDPFAPLADTGEGLINISSDLPSLLEGGSLRGACARYRGGATDRRSKLLCGKEMFFYEDYDTSGVPNAILDFLAANFPEEMGAGFSRLGMIPDPTASDGMPLGLTESGHGGGGSRAFTCAACHFARVPDGRYVVGAPNHAYDFGRHVLAIALVPTLGTGFGANPADHDALAVAKVQPMLDRLAGDFVLRARLGIALAGLVGGGSMPAFTREIEHQYATWLPGTMDFAIVPLPIDDGVHTISKILPLWSMPEADEIAARGMPHAMLSTTGNAHSLRDFMHGFVLLGGGPVEAWDEEALSPLIEYVHSLRPPPPITSPMAADVEAGAVVFERAGCVGCHDGPRGSGRRIYTFAEIGTDSAMSRWMNPNPAGEPCCGFQTSSGEPLTLGVKSPRLVGLHVQQRFLHNGAVPTLEALLCASGSRGAITELAYGDGGHLFGCELSAEDKRSLIAFLRAH